jgi:hypothetical protein
MGGLNKPEEAGAANAAPSCAGSQFSAFSGVTHIPAALA